MTKLSKRRKQHKRWTVIPDDPSLWWIAKTRIWSSTPTVYSRNRQTVSTVFASNTKAAALHAVAKLREIGGSGTLEHARCRRGPDGKRTWVGRHRCWTFPGSKVGAE